PGDDSTRFLRELRQLRDGAGLGPAELAARAHYPYDRIRAAEVGPSLPDLRPTGSSTAASAGARIGSISPAADTPDPSIILAALDRVAEEMAVGEAAALPPSADGEEAVGGTAASTASAWATTAASTGWAADAEPA